MAGWLKGQYLLLIPKVGYIKKKMTCENSHPPLKLQYWGRIQARGWSQDIH